MKTKNAYLSLFILMFVTITVAGCEYLTAVRNFRQDGNVFDFCAGAVEYVPYCMMFFLILFTVYPIALLLYRSNGIRIRSAIYKKEYLPKDILTGITLGGVSAAVAYPFTLMRTFGCSYEHTENYDKSPWLIILLFLSLSVTCGILKELYFRGFAKYFLSDVFGENTSIILTSILFGIVDWQNMGSSVILGIIWGFVYKKNDRLIIPIIAHAFINAIGIVWIFIF